MRDRKVIDNIFRAAVVALLFLCGAGACMAQCIPPQMIGSNYQFKAAGGDTAVRLPRNVNHVSVCWLTPGSIGYNVPDSMVYKWTGFQWLPIFSLTNGSATTANGNKVDLGGTQTGNVDIDGAMHALSWFNISEVGFQSNDTFGVFAPNGVNMRTGPVGGLNNNPFGFVGSGILDLGETKSVSSNYSFSNYASPRVTHPGEYTYGYEDYSFPVGVDSLLGLAGFGTFSFITSPGPITPSKDPRGGYMVGFVDAQTWGATGKIPFMKGFWSLMNVFTGAEVSNMIAFHSDTVNTVTFATGGVIDTFFHFRSEPMRSFAKPHKVYGLFIRDTVESMIEGRLNLGDTLRLFRIINGSATDTLVTVAGNVIKRIAKASMFPSGSFSQAVTAVTVVTVTIPTQTSATYRVLLTPTSLLGSAPYFVSAKTTTSFSVTYVSAITGTVTFDWLVNN